MTDWLDAYQEIVTAAKSLNVATPWFRGHRDATWTLVPTIARCRPTKQATRFYPSDEARERGVYRHFVTEAGILLPANDSWAAAFAMQHHSVPTRLLDWSTTFGVALYFAIKEATTDAAVWIMDPYTFNKSLVGKEDVPDVAALPANYASLYISSKPTPLGAAALAFEPPRYHPRVFNQRGGFTLHSDLKTSIELLVPTAFRKVLIPHSAHAGAREFLWLAGISEFSLFPDLDGLSRDLRTRYF
jgi:hypothetical protein